MAGRTPDVTVHDLYATYGDGPVDVAAEQALAGKVLANAISTGAPEGEYSGEGWNGHRLRDFLLPYEGTAAFCGMRYLDPFVIPGVFAMDDATLDARCDRYAGWLSGLGG